MPSIVSQIPQRFWDIRYDQNHDPNTPDLKRIDESPNCQNFAYEILRHFGRSIPNFRSSNLWEDDEHTAVVSDYQPLDLLLFNWTPNPWGAHVALCVGEGEAIHLAKKLSAPVVWPIEVQRAARIPRVDRREKDAAVVFDPHPEEPCVAGRLEGSRPVIVPRRRAGACMVRDASLRDAPHHEGYFQIF